jgi:hypothetical protein
VQSHLADIDKKLADLDAKVRKGGKLTVDIHDLHLRRDAFAADAQNVTTATAATWDGTKARLDKEYDDLKAASARPIDPRAGAS